MVGKATSSEGDLDGQSDGEGQIRSVLAPLYRFFLPSNRLTEEEAFEILYNPRRRATLQFLHRCDQPCSMEQLVEHISATENGVSIGGLTDQQRRRVYVSLYQTHLPMLDEAGAIEYDQSTQEIASGPAAAELTPYLDTPPERGIPWRAYYLRLFLAYVAVGGAVAVGLFPVPSVLTLTLLGVVLFLAVACLHGFDRTA